MTTMGRLSGNQHKLKDKTPEMVLKKTFVLVSRSYSKCEWKHFCLRSAFTLKNSVDFNSVIRSHVFTDTVDRSGQQNSTEGNVKQTYCLLVASDSVHLSIISTAKL